MMLNTDAAAMRQEVSSRLWLLGACAFLSLASMRVADAMLPVFVSVFETTAARAAQTISFFALAYGFLQLVYGPLGDRFGKSRVVAMATLACTVGNLSAATAQSLDWLIASRVVSGAAAAGIVPLAMAWIGDNISVEERQSVLAQFLGATVFGMICGQWLGGVLAETLGWRSAFALLALCFVTCGGALLIRESRRVESIPRSHGASQAFRLVLSTPWARTVMILTALEGAFAFSALAFIPSHLHLQLHLPLPAAGGVVALYGIGGLIYSRLARGLVQRFGQAGLAFLGATVACAAFAAMAVAPSWWLAAPACLMAGFGFYGLHNTLQTNATQMVPSARGTAVSLFACSLFLGQSLGVSAAAWTVDHFSSSVVFAVAAAGLLGVGLAFAAKLRRRVSL